MGMDQRVICAKDKIPEWNKIASLLAEHQYHVEMRMIDGELAFPDETPPDNWNELRIGTPAGMVTLRREEDGIRLTIWGNAGAEMLRAWNALTWAVAVVSDGQVVCESGTLSAADFQRMSEIP